MKNIAFLLVVGFCLLVATATQAQSSFEILAKGVSKDKYVAIKGEEIAAGERYAYMFSNLSRYRLIVKSGKTNGKVLVKIVDADKKEVATNLLGKKYHNELNFKCGKTGMYYVVFEEIAN